MKNGLAAMVAMCVAGCATVPSVQPLPTSTAGRDSILAVHKLIWTQSTTGMVFKEEDGRTTFRLPTNFRVVVEARPFLQEGEFILPRDLYDACAAIYGQMGFLSSGYYTAGLPSRFERPGLDRFIDELNYKGYGLRHGYPIEAISTLFAACTEPGNIVLNARRLETPEQIQSVLDHERLHRALDRLPEKQQETLRQGHEVILESGALETCQFDQPAPAYENWSEFYAYHIQDKLCLTDEFLAATIPEAYEIYDRARTEVKRLSLGTQ